MDQIDLTLKKDKKLGVGASKVGGKPSLPAKFAWPRSDSGRPLAFVLQLNFAELQKAAPRKELPAKGLLQLFCTLEETDLSSPQPEHAVVFHPNVAKFVDTNPPKDLDKTEGARATLDHVR